MKFIRYNLCTRTENGEFFSDVTMPWNEVNEEIAKKEAYKGNYTIEDDGQAEPDTATTEDVLNALLGVTE